MLYLDIICLFKTIDCIFIQWYEECGEECGFNKKPKLFIWQIKVNYFKGFSYQCLKFRSKSFVYKTNRLNVCQKLSKNIDFTFLLKMLYLFLLKRSDKRQIQSSIHRNRLKITKGLTFVCRIYVLNISPVYSLVSLARILQNIKNIASGVQKSFGLVQD